MNGGTVTQIGPDYTNGWGNGDLFELFAGDANDYHVVVKRQGNTIIDVTDSGHISALGNHNAGCGMKAGVDAFGFQLIPGLISSVTASDRT